MDELYELYQDIILDHNKNPRNCRKLAHPTHTADGHNPLCGDEVTVYLHIANGRVIDVSFTGQGCAISKASASLMTTVVKGLTLKELSRQTARVYELLTGETDHDASLEKLGDLAALSGVRRFPARIKCATLAWHALEAGLKTDPCSQDPGQRKNVTQRPQVSTEIPKRKAPTIAKNLIKP